MKSFRVSTSLIGIIAITCVLLLVVLHIHVSNNGDSISQADKHLFATTRPNDNTIQQQQSLRSLSLPSASSSSSSSSLSKEDISAPVKSPLEDVLPQLDEIERKESENVLGDTMQVVGGNSSAVVAEVLESPAVMVEDKTVIAAEIVRDEEDHAMDSGSFSEGSSRTNETEPKGETNNLPDQLLDSSTFDAQSTEKIQVDQPFPFFSPTPTFSPTISPTLPEIKRDTSKACVVAVEDNVYSDLIELYESKYINEVISLNSKTEIQEIDSTDIDVVYSFHKALTKGVYCSSKRSPISSSARSYLRTPTIAEDPYVSAMKLIIKSNEIDYFVEYVSKDSLNSKSLARPLAKHFQTLPIVSLIQDVPTGYSATVTSAPTQNTCGDDNEALGKNIFTSYNSKSPHLTVDGNRNCIQIIESVSFFVNDLLPFEFEQLMRDIICQCKYTVFPSRLPEIPYFANWDDINALVEAASTGNNHRCDISINDGSGNFQSIRYDTFVVQQNTTSQHGKLFAADFDDISLDSRSRFNLAVEISSFFEMIEGDTNITRFDSLQSLQDLAWNGSFLINISAPIDLSLTSYKRYLAPTKPFKLPKQIRTAKPTFSPTISSEASEVAVVDSELTSLVNTTNVASINSTDNATSTVSRRLMATDRDSLGSSLVNFAWIFPNEISIQEDLNNLDGMLVTEMKEAIRVLSTDEKHKSLLTSNNKDTSKYHISKDSRKIHSNLYRVENFDYHQWMHFMENTKLDQILDCCSKKTIMDEITASSTKLVYLFGNHLSLVSLKLSKVIASRRKSTATSDAMLVTIASDPKLAVAQHRLGKLMKLGNNIVGAPVWSIAMIISMLGAPERADISLIESDILLKIITLVYDEVLAEVNPEGTINCDSHLIKQLFSIIMSSSKISYIKFPSGRISEVLLGIIAPQCSSEWIPILNDPLTFLSEIAGELKFNVNVTIHELPNSVNNDHNDANFYRFAMNKVKDDTLELKSQEVHQKFWQKSSKQGISIYTAVWFGLIAAQKQKLLELIVNLPLWKAQGTSKEEQLAFLSPWNMFVQICSGSSKLQEQDWRLLVEVPRNADDNEYFLLGITSASKSMDITNEITLGKSLYSLIQTEFSQHSSELADGKFSFVEHDSGNGFMSARLSLEYPQATVISIERDEYYTTLHNRVVEMLNITNNAVCLKREMDDETMYRNIYECPELFRFQLMFRNVLQGFKDASSSEAWGATMGMALSSALTSFVYVPNRSLVSWGLYMLYGPIYLHESSDSGSKDSFHLLKSKGSYRSLSDAVGCVPEQQRKDSYTYIDNSKEDMRIAAFKEHYKELSSIAAHPQKPFNSFPSDWLLSTARAKDGSTSLLISPMSANANGDNQELSMMRYRGQIMNIHRPYLEFPLVRCDIVNMTRHVHHHFDYKRDGHTRTYTMRVDVNQTVSNIAKEALGQDVSTAISVVDEHGVHLKSRENDFKTTDLPLGHHPSQHNIVNVRLHRDKDNWPIPYVSIYGITLISALRLGLNNEQRDRFFHSFLQLPLYEDMAPWNIVLMGPKLDYIDYDTREFTFNEDIPKAYKVMSVLMNYKRTVEDFKKCGSKASTIYGLPFVSDCVGNTDSSLKCDDLALPVPCGDGRCHSDYISCLRSLADIAKRLVEQKSQEEREGKSEGFYEHVSQNLASAMNAVVAKFNESSYAKLTYEEFIQHQLK